MRTPLSAQEALDKFGFIILGANREVLIGKPFELDNPSARAILPAGTVVVPVAFVDKDEARKYWEQAGWLDRSDSAYLYKAVAE